MYFDVLDESQVLIYFAKKGFNESMPCSQLVKVVPSNRKKRIPLANLPRMSLRRREETMRFLDGVLGVTRFEKRGSRFHGKDLA